MACLVQKFGGTSVATLDRIKNVADIVAKSRKKHKEIVVVVSAMAGVTNKFVDCVNALGANEGHPEYDTVVSSGELVTAGLTAIALENVGLKARSYASWQVPIQTDDNYGRAIIRSVNSENLKADLEQGIIPVVCGFQGISPSGKITTLGRGGSDLTAVAVASAINADLCEIYSDVDGVYTVDPNLFAGARRIDQICYAEMLEMASQGAKVLQEQSVLYAMKKNVVIRVASSFIDAPGTIISSATSKKRFCGMAATSALSQLSISSENTDKQNIVDFLSKNFIQCDFVEHKNKKMNILVDKKHAAIVLGLLKGRKIASEVRYKFSKKPLSKISIVGNSMSDNLIEEFAKELKKNKIELYSSSFDEHKTNLIISRDQLLEAVSVLHKYCGLDR